jgi:DNA-binding HxlR family transcriptional regulator
MRVACPTRLVIDRVADKWTMLVILALEPGTLRFSALRRVVQGVTQKMLTQTLRGLERDGMVRRQVYPTVPVTVDYTLTPLGQSLSEAMVILRRWAYSHMAEIERARSEFDERPERGTNDPDR